MQGDTAVPPASTGQKPGANQKGGQWQYRPDDDMDAAGPTAQVQPSGITHDPHVQPEISWTASEFIAHHKGTGWYLLLALGAGVLVMGVYFVTKDFLSVAAVGVMAILLGVSGSRKPRVLEYRLDRAGLSVGQKFYPYSDFRAFSVVDEGAFPSIMFSPLKRFMPPLSIYYDPKDEERIIEVLAQYLPVQQQGPDVIDRVARRVRF